MEVIIVIEREKLIELINKKQHYGEVIIENQMDDRYNWHSTIKNSELANYLLENGAIVMPYKIGTTIWTNEPFKDGVVRDGDIIAFEVVRGGASEIVVNFDPVPLTASFFIEDIGKTVFFTREEAEKALAEKDSE